MWGLPINASYCLLFVVQVHLDILSSRCERSLKVVSDYVSSIRARLLDVEDFPVENSKSAASLVEQAVDEFSTSGRILSKVTEASIFCSPFYVRCFLPLLLSHAKKDNIHGGLVEKLFKYVDAFAYHIIISTELVQVGKNAPSYVYGV